MIAVTCCKTSRKRGFGFVRDSAWGAAGAARRGRHAERDGATIRRKFLARRLRSPATRTDDATALPPSALSPTASSRSHAPCSPRARCSSPNSRRRSSDLSRSPLAERWGASPGAQSTGGDGSLPAGRPDPISRRRRRTDHDEGYRGIVDCGSRRIRDHRMRDLCAASPMQTFGPAGC